MSFEQGRYREIGEVKEGRGTEQEGWVKYKFGTTQANHTLKDYNLDFPRIASKRRREEGRNNINFLAARNMHNNNILPRTLIISLTHTH